MAARIFLALSALVWLPYGVLCFFQPGYLAEAAGVAATSTTATIELRAMYGGLQAAIGLLAVFGAMGTRLRHAALVTLAFLCAGLGLSRVIGAMMAGEISEYTGFALFFEIASTGLALWFLSRAPRDAGA
jgi:hypothetical protein